MKHDQLIHALCAACRAIDASEIIVVGSQAAIGSLSHNHELPDFVTHSNEVDVISFAPERTIEIDGAIGEGSLFHDTFEYYVHGLDEDFPLPANWRDNLIDLSFNDDMTGKTITAWFLSLPDLCASKLAAGRPKDIEFVEWIVAEHHLTLEEIKESIERIPDLFIIHKERAIVLLKRIG